MYKVIALALWATQFVGCKSGKQTDAEELNVRGEELVFDEVFEGKPLYYGASNINVFQDKQEIIYETSGSMGDGFYLWTDEIDAKNAACQAISPEPALVTFRMKAGAPVPTGVQLPAELLWQPEEVYDNYAHYHFMVSDTEEGDVRLNRKTPFDWFDVQIQPLSCPPMTKVLCQQLGSNVELVGGKCLPPSTSAKLISVPALQNLEWQAKLDQVFDKCTAQGYVAGRIEQAGSMKCIRGEGVFATYLDRPLGTEEESQVAIEQICGNLGHYKSEGAIYQQNVYCWDAWDKIHILE
ncbi:MAG: hypothetical protein AB8C84_10810 [Oligoflexales bacterium]